MVWEIESCADGVDCELFEAAKAIAEDTLNSWMIEERNKWKDAFHPTEEELEKYNGMICNCSVCVKKYNPGTDEYETEWEPSCEEEEAIGWKKLAMDDLSEALRYIESLRDLPIP